MKIESAKYRVLPLSQQYDRVSARAVDVTFRCADVTLQSFTKAIALPAKASK